MLQHSYVRYISFYPVLQVLIFGFLASLYITTAVAEELMWRYTVKPGDNLITLGKQHLINPNNWKVIQRVNHIKNPYRMPIGQVLKVPVELVKQKPASAEVIYVYGQVEWQQSTTKFEPLSVGQKLDAGTRIVTKDNSKTILKFADETTVELSPNSEMQLDALSLYSGGAMVDTKIRLQKGKLNTYANPKHNKGSDIQVITPSAIAAVRGTKFRVSANAKATTQETLDGQVALVASNQEVLVNKGFGSKAELGKPPAKPVALLPAPGTEHLNHLYETLPVTFEMPKLQGAKGWVGQLANDQKLNQIVAEAETQKQQLVFGDIPDGKYFLSLKAKDQLGITGYGSLHMLTLNARPKQPAFIAPLFKEVVRKSQPTLQWSQIDEASLYAVEIATDVSFNQIVEKNKVSDTSYQLSKKLEQGNYFWRVSSIATNAQGIEDKGPAIKVSEFIYKPLPIKPDISQLKVNVINNRVYVNAPALPSGLRYDVMLENPRNNQIEVWHENDLGPEFSFLLKEYGKQTLYLRHQDSDGAFSPAVAYEFFAHPE